MLTGITFKNFKSFGKETYFKISPITLIYGVNGAGKSSILQILQFLKQSSNLESKSILSFKPRDKNELDFGSFKEIIYQHNIANNLEITFHLDNVPASTPVYRTERITKLFPRRKSKNKIDNEKFEYKVIIGINGTTGKLQIKEASIYKIDEKNIKKNLLSLSPNDFDRVGEFVVRVFEMDENFSKYINIVLSKTIELTPFKIKDVTIYLSPQETVFIDRFLKTKESGKEFITQNMLGATENSWKNDYTYAGSRQEVDKLIKSINRKIDSKNWRQVKKLDKIKITRLGNITYSDLVVSELYKFPPGTTNRDELISDLKKILKNYDFKENKLKSITERYDFRNTPLSFDYLEALVKLPSGFQRGLKDTDYHIFRILLGALEKGVDIGKFFEDYILKFYRFDNYRSFYVHHANFDERTIMEDSSYNEKLKGMDTREIESLTFRNPKSLNNILQFFREQCKKILNPEDNDNQVNQSIDKAFLRHETLLNTIEDINRDIHFSIGSVYFLPQGPVEFPAYNFVDTDESYSSNWEPKETIKSFVNMDSLEPYNRILSSLKIPYILSVDNLLDKKKEPSDVYQIKVFDKITKTDVLLKNTGFGISQFFNFIIQASLYSRDRIILKQELESYLHVNWQAKLAEYISMVVQLHIDENKSDSLENKSDSLEGMILETHSEHMILKIKQLIKKGKLDNKLVSIYYVKKDPKAASSILNKIRIDKNGDFLDEWPDGFFMERLDYI